MPQKYTLLPSEEKQFKIPLETMKALTDFKQFSKLPWVKLNIFITINGGKCKYLFNPFMITPKPKLPRNTTIQPLKEGEIIPDAVAPPPRPGAGSNSRIHEIWIPRSKIPKNRMKYKLPRVPVAGAPDPPPPLPIQPIAPDTEIYAYPFKNPIIAPPGAAPAIAETAADMDRNRAIALEKDVIKHWDFLEVEIIKKLNMLFFGNIEGKGEQWKQVTLKLPDGDNEKLFQLKVKPTFNGDPSDTMSSWKEFPGCDRYSPIKNTNDRAYRDHVNGNWPPTMEAPKASNRYTTIIKDNRLVKRQGISYKFYIYPIFSDFFYSEHPNPNLIAGRPNWPPMCDVLALNPMPIVTHPYPPLPFPHAGPINHLVTPSAPHAVIPSARDENGVLFPYFFGVHNDPQLHTNIIIDLEGSFKKIPTGKTANDIAKQIKEKNTIDSENITIQSKASNFCKQSLFKSKQLLKEVYGNHLKIDKKTKDNVKIRNINSVRNRNNPRTATSAKQKESKLPKKGGPFCGGRKTRRKNYRKKGTRKHNNRKKRTRKRFRNY